MRLCECGCGQEVTVYKGVPKRFVNGHTFRNEHHSKESKKKMRGCALQPRRIRIALQNLPRGMTAWNKGLTKETDERVMKYGRSLKGRVFSENHRRNLSKAMKGRSSWRKGLTKEMDERVRRGSEKLKGRIFTKEHRRSISEAKKRSSQNHLQNIIENMNAKPTKAEQRLIDIIQKHGLPYKYVGDYKFWIENVNPDFVECNGKKVALEVFSSYYHNPLKNIGLEYHRTYQGRIEILKKYGWKCIIFWDYEVDDEKLVLERLGVK